MEEYLVMFKDPDVGPRHTIIVAHDLDELMKLIKQRLRTPTWRSCKAQWYTPVKELLEFNTKYPICS